MQLKKHLIPFYISLGFIIVFSIWLSQGLSTNDKLLWDEFFTLERSIGFEKFNDWFHVYSDNEPTSKKPPLQYWATGLSFKLGIPELLSLKLFSFLSFIGLLCSVGAISNFLCEDNLWAVPSSVVLLCCSPNLISLACSGMLDAGASFLLMLSVLCFFYTKKTQNAWLLCGLFIGLSALQKAPIALIIIIIMLIYFSLRNDQDYKFSVLRKTSKFYWGVCIAFTLLFFWPLLQTYTLGKGYLKGYYLKQMLHRFSPIASERETDVTAWLQWLWDDWHLLAVIFGLCCLLALVCKRWRNNNSLTAITVCAILIAVSFTLATGRIFPRYLALFTPFLIIIMVKVISDAIPQKMFVFVFSIFFFVASFNQISNAKNKTDNSSYDNDNASYMLTQSNIKMLEEYLNNGDSLIVDKSLMARGACGFFGKKIFRCYPMDFIPQNDSDSNNKLVEKINSFKDKSKGNIIGFTPKSHKKFLNDVLGSYTLLEETDNAVVWRYDM